MKKTKLEKGITLIALIITIVVLLILAVVSIGAIKNSSIIAHSQNAASGYTISQEKETLQLAVGEWQLQKNNTEETTSFKEFMEETLENKNAKINEKDPEDGPLTVTFNKTGNAYSVTSNGTISVVNSSTGDNGNGGSGGDTVMPVATVGTKVDKNSTINGKEYSSNNPIIPAGFTAINTETSKWDAKEGPEVSEGLVISDGTSEFVWIPVTGAITSYVLNRLGYREPDVVTGVTPTSDTDSASGTRYDAKASYLEKTGFTEDLNSDGKVDAYDFKQQLEKEFNAMSDSVREYGGFYVGRYETSMNGSTAQSKAGEMPMTAVTWYEMYKNSKTYSTSGVISEMIWGSQWDAMMDFIGSEEVNKTGRVSHDLSSAYLTGNGQGEGQYSGNITYSDIINNIYDLEGNVWEWTKEANESSCRVKRSGCYFSNYEVKQRMESSPNNNNGSLGSRLALYVEL